MAVLISILGFILFVSLVLVHEFGHYLAARRNGVEVEEFGLGFPPRAIGRKTKSGMILSLNWLPLGGFVKLKGEHDADKRTGSFGAANMAAKTKIMLAGVGMNLVAGLLILTVLALSGMPQLITKADYGVDQFSVKSNTHISRQEVLVIYIEPNSPAAAAGLKNLDKINSLSAGGITYKTQTPDQLKAATQKLAGQKVVVNYTHGSQTKTATVDLRGKAEVAASASTNNPKGYLGVEPYSLVFKRSGWSAPVVAVGFTGQLVELTAKGLWHAVSGLGSLIAGGVTNNHAARVNGQTEAESQVGGPIAIVKILSGSGGLGLSYMLVIIAIISLTLAFMNVLPIPALDGGRLFVMLFSRLLLKRPLSRRAEERIHGTGMAVLLALMLLITIADVNRFY